MFRIDNARIRKAWTLINDLGLRGRVYPTPPDGVTQMDRAGIYLTISTTPGYIQLIFKDTPAASIVPGYYLMSSGPMIHEENFQLDNVVSAIFRRGP